MPFRKEEAVQVAAASAVSADHNRSGQASYSLNERSASTMEGPKDEALMSAYQKGDGRAFETLFSRYQDRVFGYRRFKGGKHSVTVGRYLRPS